MSLVKCPDCGKMVSERALTCPDCGRPSEYFIEQEEATINHVVNLLSKND